MRQLRPAAAALVLAAVAGVTLAALDESKSAVPKNADDRTIVHVLNRIGFGPAPGDVERVRATGLQKYIEDQLHPDRIADNGMAPRLAGFSTLTKTTRELADEYYLPAQTARLRARREARTSQPNGAEMDAADRSMMGPEASDAVRAARAAMQELPAQKILRAAYSERQLYEMLVDFWFNHFNVFAGKGPTRLYLTEYERDAIRPHVFGKFRDLLGATAASPAMLFYLDNWQSAAPRNATSLKSARKRPDMPQPAANRRPRGLNENYARELLELHTLGVDGGYIQMDVQEVARAFTGWTIATPRQGGSFRFDPRMHDDGEKVVLGHRIKAGGGRSDGERVLDILARHPSTARFIATKLARRFVADVPPPALVDRAAKRFRDTDGDLREVVRTIVTSPEFFAREAYRAKVKTPFEFVVGAIRAADLDTVETDKVVAALRQLGMPLYMCQPPTGYADRADAWVNSGALVNRMNVALAIARAPGASHHETVAKNVLANDLSDTTRATIGKADTRPKALALLLGSPEFQKR